MATYAIEKDRLMNVLPIIAAAEDELRAVFQSLHAHPEIGFEEHKTSQIVAEQLRKFGVDEVHTGIGNTGVVGLVHGKGRGNRRIGLRADMDLCQSKKPLGWPINRPKLVRCMPAATTDTRPCCWGRPSIWHKPGISMGRLR